jgi:hypothetical protein
MELILMVSRSQNIRRARWPSSTDMSAITNLTPRAIKRSTRIKHFGSISNAALALGEAVIAQRQGQLADPGATLVEAQPK